MEQAICPKTYCCTNLRRFHFGDFKKLDFSRILGRGGGGVVHEAELRGLKYAVKEFTPQPMEWPVESNTEVEFLSQLNHENIIQFFGHYSEPQLNKTLQVFAILEFCPKSLEELIWDTRKIFSYEEKKAIVGQLVKGLDYLAKRHIIHLDLKPGNILVSQEGRYKIADFGLSKKLLKQEGFMADEYEIGTLSYRAPELLKEQPYSFPIDMWSLGLVMAELWIRNYVVDGFCTASVLESINNMWSPGSKDHIDNLLVSLETPAADLVKHLLQIEPSQRATLEMVKASSFLALYPPVYSNRPRLTAPQLPRLGRPNIAFQRPEFRPSLKTYCCTNLRRFHFGDFKKLDFSRILGRGGGGVVHEAELRGLKYAVKEFTPQPMEWPVESNTEVEFLSQLNHENIIQFFGHYSEPQLNKTLQVFAILEFCPKSLEELIWDTRKIFSYEEKKAIVGQLVKGLDYLAKRHIIHLDLKPGNILVSQEGRYKIADFGLSKKLLKQEGFMADEYEIGTLSYRAPELLKEQPYSFPIDMWSLGLVMAELWIRNYVVDGFCTASVLESINNMWSPGSKDHIDNLLVSLETPAADLVKHLLQIEPSQRATLEMVKASSFLALYPPVYSNRPRLTAPQLPRLGRPNIAFQRPEFRPSLKTYCCTNLRRFHFGDFKKLDFSRILGRGGGGVVHEAELRGLKYAVKEFTPQPMEWPVESNTEVEFLSQLNHENIIQFFGHYSEPQLNKTLQVFAILEFCPKSLEELIWDTRKIFSYEEKKAIVGQLVKGLDYLAKRHIIHLDLKPGNILVSQEGRYKIADFGLSKKLLKQEGFMADEYEIGTLSYRAPELLKEQPYSFPIDMWSLGLVMAELWIRNYVVDGFCTASVLEFINNMWSPGSKDHIDNLLVSLETPAADLVKHLLQIEPSQRATLEMVKASSFLALYPPVYSNRPRLTAPQLPRLGRPNIAIKRPEFRPSLK
ncbi:hypothetical protein LAZ67_14002935, partial [Cordylochernes scorpioides]